MKSRPHQHFEPLTASMAHVGPRELVLLAAYLTVSLALLIALRGVVPRVTSLYPLTLPANPYVLPEHAALLYVATPLAVLSAVALFFAPGLLFVLALGRAEHLSELVLKSFGATFLWYVVTSTAMKIIWPPLTASGALLAAAVSGALGWGLLALRVRRGDTTHWPLSSTNERRRFLWCLVIIVLLVLTLLPVLFWQDLNGDGFEDLEAGRSLIANILPLNLGLEIISGVQGRVSLPYPISWFALLFGPLEGAARLPLVLHMIVVFAGLLALIEQNSPRRMRPLEEVVLLMALAVYVVTVSYSASYSPYFADLNVAASESLPVGCMLAAACFIWTRQFTWALLFAALAYFGRPTGLLFLLLLGLGFLISGPFKRVTPQLKVLAATIALSMLAMWVYQHLLVPWVSGWTQPAEPGTGIAARLAYLRLDDYRRLLYLLMPSGILPAFALLAVRRHDLLGRSLTIVSVGYFLFFYLLAFVALHHFIPVMLLPLVVFWRLALRREPDRRLLAGTAAAAALAFWLSLPNDFEVDRTLRPVARALDYRITDQQALEAGLTPARVRQDMLFKLFPAEWSPVDPASELVITDGPIIYYSRRLPRRPEDINYIVQLSSDAPPSGFIRVADNGFGAVYVRDLSRWQRDRFPSLRTDYRSPLYEVSRETLFRNIGRPAGNYTIDLGALACRSFLRRWAGPDRCTHAGY